MLSNHLHELQNLTNIAHGPFSSITNASLALTYVPSVLHMQIAHMKFSSSFFFLIVFSHLTFLYQAGWSSLMAASRNGHVEVVDKLLQHGARVDLQDEVYRTITIISNNHSGFSSFHYFCDCSLSSRPNGTGGGRCTYHVFCIILNMHQTTCKSRSMCMCIPLCSHTQ